MTDLRRTIRNIDLQRSRQDGIRALAGAPILLSGEFRFTGAGENTVEVVFPQKFWERPVTTFGWRFHSTTVNQVPTTLLDGGYPEVNVGAVADIVDSSNANRILYTGMIVAVKTRGKNNQKLVISWHAHGLAFSGPIP